ncbi:FHA domain-containing protein [Mycobacterium sp. MS1601]|uniref:FHA domain-containing protein n=1 Tax=Mycobacterium sp. MS1601 TaxID=1936029 RepID=UPI0009F9EB2D|nr:FHA domain-containing protein [Mycobacterium sp. MS1601]
MTIGRGPASAIRLDHSWLSRTHVRLRAEDNRWIMVDCSANGMYIDTERHESVVVTDGLAVQLGRPDGLTVRFTYAHADQPDEITDDPADPDIAGAGAAVAARRRELELTQRGLARDRIINAGALISFEKGRGWPHESTRT